MDDESSPYHFNADGSELSTMIVEAVAFVTGRAPADLDPLSETVDPDALNQIVEHAGDAVVEFSYEGVAVHVTSDNDVFVEELDQDPSTQHSDGTANVLVLDELESEETCAELLAREETMEPNILGVTYSQSPEDRMQVWGRELDPTAGNTTVISMGSLLRSSAGAVGESHSFPITLVAIEKASDLGELGHRLNVQIQAWETNAAPTSLCFHSITDMLAHVDEQTALQFLRTLTDRVDSLAITAHYHMDASAHDDATIARFRECFDAVVEL